MPVRELGELVRTRKVSPVELAETFLDHLETIGPQLNAVVTVTRERAIQQARRAEEEIASGAYRGPLHGIPYGVKDLLATSGGIPTTWGEVPFRNQTFDYDASVVRRLEEAGAVLAAKLATVELANGMVYQQPDNTFTGRCLNPWDRSRGSGASSSGSGAAVSAGLVPFAIGSETFGSILSPSSSCGLSGLRPTYGRVSRYGAMALSWTLDKLGPMCLTADDCGLVLDAIAGPDANDPTAADRPFVYEPDTAARRFALAVPKNATDGVEDVVRVNFERALEVMGKVATVEEVELPNLPYWAITRTIELAEASGAFDGVVEKGRAAERTLPDDEHSAYHHINDWAISNAVVSTVLARDYLRALRLRGVMARAFEDLLSGYHALVAPTVPRVAAPLDQKRPRGPRADGTMAVWAAGNGAGLPSIAVPSGFSDDGLPTSMQFMGRAYDENAIMSVARAYQSLTDWHRRHPPDLVPAV